MDHTEAMVRQAFQDAVGRLQRSVDGEKVLQRLAGRDVQGAIDDIDWPGWSDALDSMKERLGQRAANAAHEALLGVSAGVAVRYGGTMDKAAARAIAGVGEHITGIDRRTRAAVRDAIARGLRDGKSIPDIARGVQNVVGLTDGQSLALDRFEKQMVKDGIDPAQMRIRSAAYRDRLLRARGESIARSETMWAQNQGRIDGYSFAVANGAVGTDAKMQWVAADGCCDICDDLDGEEITIGDTFSDGSDAPPAHPNCRCTTILSDFGTIPEDQ